MKKTIVIADDFENTRHIIKLVLQKLDVEIHEAVDGKDALKYFDGRPVDLLITDYNMPNMNGADLVGAIRGMERYKFIPALMLTTEINQDKKAKAMEVKVTSWIQKPFKQEELIVIVKKCLRIS